MSTNSGDHSLWLAPVGLALGLLGVILLGGGGLVYYAFNLLAKTEPSPTDLYASTVSKHPVIDDPLDGSKVGNWETYTRGQGSCIFKDSALHIIMQSVLPIENPTTTSPDCFLHNVILHNFAFQVRMTTVHGDGIFMGMFFRANKAEQDAYRFYLDPYGDCNFVTEKNGKPVGAPISVAAPGIKERSSHIVMTIAQNSLFYLYLDAEYVNKVTNNLYPAGRIGLFVTRDSLALTDVAFTNAKVWQL